MKKLVNGMLMLCVCAVLVGCGTAPTWETTTTTAWNNGEVAVEAGELATLATCLTDNGVTMYGTNWCSHCKDQKAMFGDAFAQVNYVDCDASKPACVAAGVQWFPTWKDNAGNAYPGTQSLERLASIAGCEG